MELKKNSKLSLSMMIVVLYMIFLLVDAIKSNVFDYNLILFFLIELITLFNIYLFENYKKSVFNIIFNCILCLLLAYYDYNNNFILVMIFVTMNEIMEKKKSLYLNIVFIVTNILIFILVTCFDNLKTLTLNTGVFLNNIMMYILFFIMVYYLNKYKEEKNYLEKMNKQIEEFSIQDIENNTLKKQKEISQILHDSIGNKLVALIMYIGILKRKVKKDSDNYEDDFMEIEKLANEVLEQLRLEVYNINNLKFDIDLNENLEKLFIRYRNFSVVDINYNTNLDEKILTPEQKYFILSLIRESITNSVYHGKSTKINIIIKYDYEDKVFITIEDNGVGCKKIVDSHGIKGIKRKAARLNGSVIFKSENRGFIVQAILYIDNERCR